MPTSSIVERHIPCPSCVSTDAYCLYDDGHGYCFSCEYLYLPNRTNDLNDFTYEFLPWRGVSKDTMEFYGVKTKINADGKPVSLGFPYQDGSFKVRTLDKKEFYTVGATTAGLFGRDKFTAGAHKWITITEGELDALSLHQALQRTHGKVPVVSVHSASSAERDAAVDRSYLNDYERIYLAFDDDAPGREAASRVARLFDYNKVYHVKWGRRKDANDYLRHGEQEELVNIWSNAKHYLPETVISSFSEFKNILDQEHNDGVPYPFPKLTEMTYGIRTGESVLLTAQEGVGKTELMHAIEYKLLMETDANVASIFLEEPKRRHLQSLAGIHLQKPAHLPDSGVTDADVYQATRECVGRDDRLHIYNHFGSDDPEVLLDTVRFLVTARNCRYVLLDHISMVVSGHSENDERRILDYISTRLEMMVKELDFALIIVSHVNDMGQTRGSRYISKVADIRIDMDRDIASGSNIVNLKISKPSRFSGKSGPAGSYEFNPQTRQYTQLGDNDNGHSDIQKAG